MQESKKKERSALLRPFTSDSKIELNINSNCGWPGGFFMCKGLVLP